MYFVKEITGAHDSDPAAYKSPLGIVISKNSSDHVVAHEIGHALGMEDCYIANKRFSPPINIAGMGDPVSSQMFDDKGHDWGLESGRGFYPAHETIATTLPQMVMYGWTQGILTTSQVDRFIVCGGMPMHPTEHSLQKSVRISSK